MFQGPAEGCSVEWSEEFVHLRWSPGTWISARAAADTIAYVRKLCAGQEGPAIVEIAGVKGMDRQAEALFAAETFVTRTAIVGSSHVDEVMITFYKGRHNPARPTRFFYSRDEARDWLQPQDASD